MHVHFKAAALLSMSDKQARKSKLQFGALVGSVSKSDIYVTDAFDLRTDGNNIVDFEYLHKRLTLLLAVSNNANLVGLYSIEETDFESILTQFQNEGHNTPAICVTTTTDIAHLRCVDSLSNDQISVTIRPGETEEIATSTVHNHANYSKEEPELVENGEESLLLSLNQLELLTRKILASSKVSSETDRNLVHLANLVANYKAEEGLNDWKSNHELLTSQLCLLDNQLAAINGAENQVARHIMSQLTKTYHGTN